MNREPLVRFTARVMASAPSDGQSRRLFGTLRGQRRFFSPDDDRLLREFKADPASLSWPEISERMPGFSTRQLRERWCNYLCPALKTSTWTEEEDAALIRHHAEIGPRWGVIGARMGNRSAPDVKNRFQSLRNNSLKAAPPPIPIPMPTFEWRTGPTILPPLLVRNESKREGPLAPPDRLSDFSIRSILLEPGRL
jgi:hypothetical protein